MRRPAVTPTVAATPPTTISKTDRYSFFLPCEPMPTPRPRATTRGGKFASVYQPREYMDWKAELAESVRGVNDFPGSLLTQPLTVTVVARVEKPRTSKLPHPSPDVDNYVKGVLDAITQSERFWADDKQVSDLRVIKRWADPDTAPGFEVTIHPS